jgi:hypothetical protein
MVAEMDLTTGTDIMKNANVIWSDVPDYEDLYEVSNQGHVRRKGKTKCLKPVITSCGYQQVTLSKNNIRVSRLIHRLVAAVFVDGDTSLSVNHIDGNKQNNCFNNLEWITKAENTALIWHTPQRTRKISLELYPVIQELRSQGLTQVKLAERFNCSRSMIRFICSKKPLPV